MSSDAAADSDPLARYARQMRLAPIGRAGQERLHSARALLVGCGALGTAIADLLVRAGVGYLRIADRDLVERSNLQRQTLFDERDAREAWPKAEAAARRLREVNADVHIEACVTDVGSDELPALMRDVDILLDGTDNFETRYLLNDAAVQAKKPWIYGGAVGDHGLEMAVIPSRTACLRCVFPEPPQTATTETCESAGVLGPLTMLIAALQSTDALKILSGNATAIASEMIQVELWSRRMQTLKIPRQAECPCCAQGEFPYLHAERATRAESLCGRNTVQLRPAAHARLDFENLERRLNEQGIRTERSRFWLRFRAEGLEVTAFQDGRLLVHGTEDPSRARSFHSRWLGA